MDAIASSLLSGTNACRVCNLGPLRCFGAGTPRLATREGCDDVVVTNYLAVGGPRWGRRRLFSSKWWREGAAPNKASRVVSAVVLLLRGAPTHRNIQVSNFPYMTTGAHLAASPVAAVPAPRGRARREHGRQRARGMEGVWGLGHAYVPPFPCWRPNISFVRPLIPLTGLLGRFVREPWAGGRTTRRTADATHPA